MLWLIVAIVIATLLVVRTTTPIAALPADADPKVFSAGRAMQDIAVIARAPHPLGSGPHRDVRDYLVARFTGLGLQTDLLPVTLSGASKDRLAHWSGWNTSALHGIDIVATWPGRDRTQPAILVMAHYDTVWASPGAGDDSAGLATILEEIRALKAARVQPQRDIMFLITDAEELGLDGAHGFFDRSPLAARVGMVVNHETRGGGGRTAMFETGPGNDASMRLFAGAVPHPSVNSVSVLIYNTMPNSTDYTVAKRRGIAGYNFAFTGRPSLYHSPLATPQAIEQAAVQDMGEQSLALLRALADAPQLPAATHDAVFSDLLGWKALVYSPNLGWAIAGITLLVLGLATARGDIGARAIGQGMIAAFWAMLLAAALLAGLNALSTGPAHPQYYDRLAALPRLEVQALLACVAALAIGASAVRGWRKAVALILLGLLTAWQNETRWFGAIALLAAAIVPALPRQIGIRARWLGAAWLVAIGGTIVQAIAPTATPILAWPGLIAAIIILVDRQPVTALLAACGTAQALGFAHFVFDAVGAGLPMAMALFVPILMALALPLFAPGGGRALPAGIVGLALCAAAGIALWVRLDAPAASAPTYHPR
jgi:hypothetical protein